MERELKTSYKSARALGGPHISRMEREPKTRVAMGSLWESGEKEASPTSVQWKLEKLRSSAAAF